MERVEDLIDRHFAREHGRLTTGGVTISELASAYGTPLFIYDRAAIDRQLERLRSALPGGFEIFYSVKANPNVAVLRHFLQADCGLEIASAGEFEQARAAGCPAERLIFAGPGKTQAELELVVTAGIGEIHAESDTELGRIKEICDRIDVSANVALRINPAAGAAGGAIRMGGAATPFGVDEEQLEPLLDRVVADERLEFSGIHLFAGTQILDHEVLLAQYRQGLDIARRVSARTETPIPAVDFGGGLGVPYFPGERALDLGALEAGLGELMADLSSDDAFAGTRFVLEPGRFLVGEAGIYLTQVTDIKISRDKKFLITDGGMHHHLAASGNLGATIKRNFPIAVAERLDVGERETVDVVGPLCTPLDTIGRDVSLPPAQIGDLLAIFQSGAYARAASPLGFLSHPSPPEVWTDTGVHTLVRARSTSADLLLDQAMSVPGRD